MNRPTETFLTTLYTIVDDWYQQHAPRLLAGKAGKKPLFSDSEVMTLSLAQHWLGMDEERGFLRYVRNNFLALFPRLIDQSQFNRRARASSTDGPEPVQPTGQSQFNRHAACPARPALRRRQPRPVYGRRDPEGRQYVRQRSAASSRPARRAGRRQDRRRRGADGRSRRCELRRCARKDRPADDDADRHRPDIRPRVPRPLRHRAACAGAEVSHRK